MLKRLISALMAIAMVTSVFSLPANAAVEKHETVTGKFYCTFENNDYDSHVKTLRGVAADNTWGMQFPIINEIIEKKVSFDTVKSVIITVKASNTASCDKGTSPRIELHWNTRDNNEGASTAEFKNGTATLSGTLPSGTRQIVLNPYAFSASAGEITFDVTIDVTYEEPTVEPESGYIGYPNAKDIKWELSEDGTLTFSGKGNMRPLNRNEWFFEGKSVRKIVIEEGITSIGSYVFQKCDTVKSVEIASSVTTIGMYAFDMCWELTSVKMGEGVTRINSNAFRCCNKLQEIQLPDSLTYIGKYCFDRCIALPEINIPGNVTTIDEEAFTQCDALEKVTLGGNLSTIESGAFEFCKSLTEIIIPDSVENIGKWAFRGCEKLKKMIVPSVSTSFGQGATLLCDRLTVYGKGGSTAQEWCGNNDVKFVAIEFEQGDINADGKIDSIDLELVKEHITAVSLLSDGSFARANMNGDDAVDIRDYNLLFAKINGRK